MGRSRYVNYLVVTESRYLKARIQRAIRVNAACATFEEVGVGCEHGDSHEACEGYHGKGENT